MQNLKDLRVEGLGSWLSGSEHFLHKHEDLSSDSQNTRKKLAWVHPPITYWGWRQSHPGSVLGSQPSLTGKLLTELGTLSQKMRWRASGKHVRLLCPARPRRMRTHTHTLSHMHAAQGHLGKPELDRREEDEKAQTKALFVVSVGGVSGMR